MPQANIDIVDNDGVIALTGTVPNVNAADQAASLASGYGNKVLNLLEIAGGQQVLLQIRFAEVSRTATNELGVSFAMSDGTFTLGSNAGHQGAFSPGDGSAIERALPAAANFFGRGAIGGTEFEYFITALKQNNLLRTLAEPNLIAISGQEAEFLAGGDFPIPIVQGGNDQGTSITVEFREFGVMLRFLPVVMGDGRIRLRLNPEVSDVDFTFAVESQGFRIPGRRTRRLTTTVEMQEGETFAVGGLLDNRVASNKSATPFLGELPVIGPLFRSVRYQRSETELVVLVTPRLVKSLKPGEVPALPGEDWRHPTEMGLYLNGDIGGPMEKTKKPSQPARRYIGSYGFIPAEGDQPAEKK
jgi:pilus assembly protein CpaC